MVPVYSSNFSCLSSWTDPFIGSPRVPRIRLPGVLLRAPLSSVQLAALFLSTRLGITEHERDLSPSLTMNHKTQTTIILAYYYPANKHEMRRPGFQRTCPSDNSSNPPDFH